MQITREETDARHGRYIARIPGIAEEAVIWYTHQGPDVISADRTILPESMVNQGVRRALVEWIIENAASEGLMIVPICPFVQQEYAAHPEWERHFTSAPGEIAHL